MKRNHIGRRSRLAFSLARAGDILRSRRGMTLVEAIVAVAIIGLCTLLLLGAFGAAANLTRRGTDTANSGGAAFSMLESGEGTGTSEKRSVSFTADGATYTVDGTLRGASDGDDPAVTCWAYEAASGVTP